VEVKGANNLCVFKVATAQYADLTGDSDVTSTVFPASYFTVTALGGEVMPLFGKQWAFDNVNNALSIMSNGRLYIGIDTTEFAILDVLYADSVVLADNSSKISYKIDGPAGHRVLKVQWKNMRIATGPAGNFINVQIWIYQETGVVEFRYGPRSANNASGYNDPVTGIYTGIWYSNLDFSVRYEKMNLKGTPPNIIVDSALNLNVPNLLGVPDSGTIYRFVPKAVATSVSSIKEDAAFEIYPNPAANEITGSLSSSRYATEAILVDISGRPVKAFSIPSYAETFRLPVEDVVPGAYQLTLRSGNGSATRRVIVTR
jgi:hypothetical protein